MPTRYGSGGETVTQAFIRVLTALSGDWPVMFAPTAFDVGGARLAVIDLAEVAPQGSAEADRQSAGGVALLPRPEPADVAIVRLVDEHADQQCFDIVAKLRVVDFV